MKQVVLRVLPAFGGSLVERDVREDAETKRRYLVEIPVLLLGDTEVARHRISEAELAARLGCLVTGQP
jgi:hypothetical protein